MTTRPGPGCARCAGGSPADGILASAPTAAAWPTSPAFRPSIRRCRARSGGGCSAPMGGAGLMVVALAPTLWYGAAVPFATATLGVVCYRFFTLFVPMPRRSPPCPSCGRSAGAARTPRAAARARTRASRRSSTDRCAPGVHRGRHGYDEARDAPVPARARGARPDGAGIESVRGQDRVHAGEPERGGGVLVELPRSPGRAAGLPVEAGVKMPRASGVITQ